MAATQIMSRKPHKQVQTKLVRVSFYRLCEKCGEEVYQKLFDLHVETCTGPELRSTQEVGEERRTDLLFSPPRSIPETCCSSTSPSAFDQIMSTLQVTLHDHFHLHYEGQIGGRHRWTCSFAPPPTPVWTGRKKYLRISPTDPSCIELTLSTNLTPADSLATVLPLSGFPRAMLLSILQKNIRRQRREGTVRTSMQIIANLGFWELARRLCVINIEETVMHPDYAVLAWSMATGREFTPPQCLVESVLQIAADIASIPVRDPPSFSPEGACLTQWASSLPLPKCLLLRAFYRGMASDIKMLHAAAQSWNQRLNRDSELLEQVRRLYEPIEKLQESEMGRMRTVDVPLAAIDGGVSSVVGAM